MARRAYLYSTSLVLRWMIRLNIGVLLFLFAASPVVVPIFFNIARAAGNTYYVDNCVTVGSDSNNGTSPSTPWLTINKVNISSFSAGDSILFRRTCTFREQLTVPSSGSAGNVITFGAYGSGAKPILNGTQLVSSWTLDSGSKYYATVTPAPRTVFEDDTTLLAVATSVVAMTAGSEFYDSGASRLYVWTVDSSSPAGHTIEASAYPAMNGRGLIYAAGKSYFTINGLRISKSHDFGVEWDALTGPGSNVTITNCDFDYGYRNAITPVEDTHTYANVTITNNTFANGGVERARGGSEGVAIDIFGFQGGLVDGNIVYSTLGSAAEAIQTQGGANNVIISNNTVTNALIGIYIAAGYGNGADTTNITVRYNNVYNTTIPNYAIASEGFGVNIDGLEFYGNVAGGAPSYGLMFGNNGGGSVGVIKNAHIYNNTFYGHAIGIMAQGPTMDASNQFKNNLIKSSPGGYSWYQVDTNESNYSPDYNLFNGGGGAGDLDIHWLGTDYTLAAFKIAKSKMMNSIAGDPKFTNPASNDFTLQSTSPAIDAGTNLGSPYNMGLDPRTSFPWSTLDQGIYGSWEIGAFVYVPNLGSGNQTEPRYDFLNNSTVSATSNHTLVFTVPNSLDNTGGSSSDTLALTFQSNFNLANITCGDVNVATGTRFLFNVASPEPRTNCPNTTTSWGLLVNSASRTITITVPTNVKTYVATGTIITVNIGANANYQNQGTHWIVNPTDSGTKSITIGGTFGGSGQILVSVNPALQLSAGISETLTLTLTGLNGSGTGGMNSCSSDGTHDAEDGGAINLVNTTAASVPFGTLNNTNTFYEGCQKVSVTTNAGNGFTVAVREDHPLRTAGGTPIADTACDGSGCLNTPSTAAAWVTNTNSGLGISCAHSTTSQSCWTANPNWVNGTRWAPIASEGKNNPTGGTQTPAIFSGLTSATGVEVITKAKYRVAVPASQSAGTYTNLVSFIATPVF
jgi:hypothetical protein